MKFKKIWLWLLVFHGKALGSGRFKTAVLPKGRQALSGDFQHECGKMHA